EEPRCEGLLTDGLPALEVELAKVWGTRSKMLSGEVAFRLYDTFGVPYEFTEDTAATQGITVDRAGYESAMEAQRERARAGSAFGTKKGEDFVLPSDADDLRHVGDRFEGYATTRVSGVPVVAVFDERRRPVEALAIGERGYAALAKTPFYIEAGGQVSDSGRIVNEATGASATVEGLARIQQGLPRAHRVRVTN